MSETKASNNINIADTYDKAQKIKNTNLSLKFRIKKKGVLQNLRWLTYFYRYCAKPIQDLLR